MPARTREGGNRVDLMLKGRGVNITDRIREATEHRVARLDGPRRPSITRLEVEIIEEPTPRIHGGHRVQLMCVTSRRTFRSEASGPTIDEALDLAVDRLNRQIATYRGKRESRTTRAGSHTMSTMASEQPRVEEAG
jgi:ribosomal subunit interface protein